MTTSHDTLVVTLSEDAYEGDAKAKIAIDGTLLTATPITITAARVAGQTQAFTVHGNFGSEPHNLAISFLNDAYGGSPTLDRNLYIDEITLDGQQLLSGGSIALYTTSTDSFEVGSVTGSQQYVSFGPSQYISAGDILQYNRNQSWSVATRVQTISPPPRPHLPNLPQGGADLIFGNTNGSPYTGYEMWIRRSRSSSRPHNEQLHQG